MDSLEVRFLRPRQVRYQAALRPDMTNQNDYRRINNTFDYKRRSTL